MAKKITPPYATWGSEYGDGASPDVMGMTSLGLDVGILYDFLYIGLLLDVILRLEFLGLTLS
jgi:hypothetical protein